MVKKAQPDFEKEYKLVIEKIKGILIRDDDDSNLFSEEIRAIEKKYLDKLFDEVSRRIDRSQSRGRISKKTTTVQNKSHSNQ